MPVTHEERLVEVATPFEPMESNLDGVTYERAKEFVEVAFVSVELVAVRFVTTADVIVARGEVSASMMPVVMRALDAKKFVDVAFVELRLVVKRFVDVAFVDVAFVIVASVAVRLAITAVVMFASVAVRFVKNPSTTRATAA